MASRSASASSTLPFLPGYSIPVDVPETFHKQHQFDLSYGVPVTDVFEHRQFDRPVHPDDTFPKERPEYSGIEPDKWHKKLPVRNPKEIPLSRLPPWIVYNNQVLRFQAYFKDQLQERPNEFERVRACTIFYYLEDDSIHVEEVKDQNSGMKQGLFIKRHQIPFNSDRYVKVHDLAAIGREITFYAKTFVITDCDPFTRKFLKGALNISIGPAMPTPIDAFHAEQRATAQKNEHKSLKQASDITKFVEAQQGKTMRPALLRTCRFLAYDRQVLRFWAVWRDPGLYGELRPFIIHFFRADGTLEVLEVKQPNSGRDSFPALVKRVRLPKRAVHANQAQIGADESVPIDSDEFYKETDFRIGGSIDVFGRELILTDTDEYTRDFYKQQYNLTDDELAARPQITPEQHTYQQDRLRAVAAAAKESNEHESHPVAVNAVPLRFEALLTTKRPEDRERRFIVTFFKDDSTVAIFEAKVRNSGFVGGKFLERTFLSDVKSEMFYIGSTLKLNGFPFQLTGADMFTLQFMESHADLFPAANIDLVEHKLRLQLRQLGEMTSSLLAEAKANVESHGTIAIHVLKLLFDKFGMALSIHECLTLARSFNRESHGSMRIGDLEKCLLRH